MNKRTTAAALTTALSVGVLGIATASPALAKNGADCGVYGKNRAFTVNIGIDQASTGKGTLIRLRVHVFRNGQNCKQSHVEAWQKQDGATRFAQIRKVGPAGEDRGAASIITGDDGQATDPLRPRITTQYFFQYNFDAHTGNRSPAVKIIVG